MTEPAIRRPIRIANCSGFYGDRLSAMDEMVRGGEIDVVTGDYLAEVTMLVLAKSRLKDSAAGYATTFEKQVIPLLGEIRARGVKVVVNAGGLNPAGLAQRLRAACESGGVDLSVAHVEGDDILPDLDRLQAGGHSLPHLDDGRPLKAWGREPLTANAYLGAGGIVAALRAGADIVICPRVTDASLVVGPAAWWHGWEADDWDALAGAVAAGHVIECGTQASGGNFSGVASLAVPIRPGFPLAEIAADGTSVITKHPGTGGAVTVGTVTAQLLYEIQTNDYLNPDVILHLDSLRLREIDPDRVLIEGARGSPPPPTTKVALTALGGFENSTVYVLTGLDADAKAALLEAGLRAALAGAEIDELRFDRIGADGGEPLTQLAATSLLRVSVKGSERAVGRAFFDATVELGLSSYPGLFSLRGDSRSAKAFGVYWPGLVPQSVLRHEAVMADGTRHTISPPLFANAAPERPSPPGAPHRVWDELEDAPLGAVFDARSGDKGGNGNVGVWAHDQAGYSWLAQSLTSDAVRKLLPEARDLVIERHLLPNLYAVNFVLKGLLGGGATETLRFDPQAKALGEYLRAKRMAMPRALLDARRRTLSPH